MTEAELIALHQSEIPTWGHLPAAMRFKQAAVRMLGVEAAFTLVRAHLSVPSLDQLRQRPIVSLREAALNRSVYFNELWQGGHRFDRAALRVVGAGNHGPLPGWDRSAYLTCLPDATVRSRSALVFSGSDALMDFEGEEYSRVTDIPQLDPSLLQRDGNIAWTMESNAPEVELDEAFVLFGRNAVDFGHWITEYLPRYVLARMAGLPDHVPVLIDAGVPATVREALASYLPGSSRLVIAPHLAEVRVGRLWCASNPIFSAFYPASWPLEIWSHLGCAPAPFARIVREWLRMAGPGLLEPTGDDLIFLARKPATRNKRLLNHARIEELASERGFRIVYPEDLSLHEQIRLVANARQIIAPEGSNGLLSWFAKPGCKVCLLSPPYTLPLVDLNAILLELGIELTVLTGPDLPPATDDYCGFWNDYRIAPDGFSLFLDNWLS